MVHKEGNDWADKGEIQNMKEAIPLKLTEKSSNEDRDFTLCLYNCPDCGAILMPREVIERCYSCGTDLVFGEPKINN